MAQFKHLKYFSHLGRTPKGKLTDFDRLSEPGHLTPLSGIYRCEGCAWEIVIDAGLKGRKLPSRHPGHDKSDGPIRWRLIVTDLPIDPVEEKELRRTYQRNKKK
jgi:hypothetical protein